jgi:hypothetical protein
LDDSSSELMLLASAPGEDSTVGAESEDVVGSCGYLCDFLQIWEENGSTLYLGGGRET